MGLKTPAWFNHLSDNQLTACYNSAGINYMPEILQRALNRLRKFAPEAILIYNVEYQYTKYFYPLDYEKLKKFHAVNYRLWKNAECLAKANKPWYSPCLRWQILVAWYAWHVCNRCGYEEWIWQI
jgi:hypothetical protein